MYEREGSYVGSVVINQEELCQDRWSVCGVLCEQGFRWHRVGQSVAYHTSNSRPYYIEAHIAGSEYQNNQMYRYVNLKLCALMTFSSDWGNNIESTLAYSDTNNHVAGMKLTFQNIIRINSLSVWNFIGNLLALFWCYFCSIPSHSSIIVWRVSCST